MSKVSKKLQVANAKVDKTKVYPIAEAVKLAKETSVTKFDSTVEVAFNLNVDPRHADQQIRGAIVLPAATPEMMGELGKIGKILGPKGLMPNPKTGTVTVDVTKALDEIKKGKVEYRTDKEGNVHSIIGKASFKPEDLQKNYAAILDAIRKAKPQTVKGIQALKEFQNKNIMYHFPEFLNDKLVIGKFCAIAENVKIIMSGANHRINSLSTFPFEMFNELGLQVQDAPKPTSKGDTIIGIKIGNGAIIAAKAVVVKDVEPYTIVAGNPAKVVKKRFNESTISKLENLKW
ncbi:hypothetical protein FQR65_LT17024 [Abscondita terminalis]|nr:hypothetical protein FQR65_LT17024 [Abscondita terminalis]